MVITGEAIEETCSAVAFLTSGYRLNTYIQIPSDFLQLFELTLPLASQAPALIPLSIRENPKLIAVILQGVSTKFLFHPDVAVFIEDHFLMGGSSVSPHY